MDFVQLLYFEALARNEHMTKAAQELHVAQPALSRSLRNLEEALGLQLFDRRGKSIHLNENGRILLRHARHILQGIADSKAELAERSEAANRQVSISMFAGTKLLPQLIKGFQAQHPDISLHIRQQQESGDEIALDCDIAVYSSISPANGAGRVTLLKENICLALPSEHRFARLGAVELAQAAREPFICLYKGKGLRNVTDEYCRRAGFVPNIAMESDSPATVRELIALGVGFAFVPTITWSGMDENPGVALVDIKTPECVRYINMAWEERRYHTRAFEALREYLRLFFGGLTR